MIILVVGVVLYVDIAIVSVSHDGKDLIHSANNVDSKHGMFN